MKKILLICLLFCCSGARSQTLSDTFFLKGKISGSYTGNVKLYYMDKEGKRKQDSSLVSEDGRFTITGAVGAPAMAFLAGNVKSKSVDDPASTQFFLEPGVITIDIKGNNFKDAVISGSRTQGEYIALEKI